MVLTLSFVLASLFLSLGFMYAKPVLVARLVLAASRYAVGLRRREIAIPGFKMVYLEGGRGAPLVLLHGMGADKDNFLLVARMLRRHYRVLIPDLPGFGESDKPEAASYRVEEQIQRLRMFAAMLGLPRFHIGGNSMGGLIAGAYAVAHPGQIESMWLLAPAGVRTAEASELMQAVESGNELPILARNIEEVRRLMAFVTHQPRYLPRFFLAYLAAQQRRNYALNQRIVSELVQGPFLDDLISTPSVIPALIVWGDRDRALHMSGAEVLRRLMPRSHVVIMKGVGHVPMIETPARAVADYLEFRESLAAAESVPEFA